MDLVNKKTTNYIRGREFTDAEIQVIRSCTLLYYSKGRTKISQAICEQLNWRQPNGWLKDRACRDVLRKLEKDGILCLPPDLTNRGGSINRKRELTNFHDLFGDLDITSPTTEYPNNIEFIFSKGNHYEKLWNLLIDKYHYLGHKVTVGRCIKYLIKSGNRIIGAICYSSPSWHLDSRDTVLGNIGIANPRDYAINNSRFLILPNVKVKNLASTVLSMSTKRIIIDWEEFYSIKPLIAETFVQPSLFEGTCYKAANWIEIGKTKGFAKRGSSYHNSQEPKLIFMYGLNKVIRKQLVELF